MQKIKSRILTALFDVRPVTDQGDLDIEKIKKIETVLDLRERKTKREDGQRKDAIEIKMEELLTREEILAELDEIEAIDALSGKEQVGLAGDQGKESSEVSPDELTSDDKITPSEDFYFPEVASQDYPQAMQLVEQPAVVSPRSFGERLFRKGIPKKGFLGFLITGLLISLIIPGAAWVSHSLAVKEDVLNSGLSAYQNLLSAQESLERADWQAAVQNFSLAHFNFLQTEEEIKKLGQLTLGILERLPGGSLVSSGSHLVKVGENLAQAGQNLASMVNIFSFNNLFNLIGSAGSEENSLTDLMVDSQVNLNQALAGIRLANQELTQVKIKSLPTDIQESVASLAVKLPLVEEMLSQAIDYSAALLNILGHNNPRQYLLLFQNNSEIRATGGFIGTYGLLALDRGRIKELFIEGIFNIDGQLHEKIIPPRPIQKISTAWSMHDANWFADFPASAEKVTWFYEKAGGPTVDGVISFTPTVIERLMKLTGSISMPEYDLILTPENFVEFIQYQVEIDYDQELNQPKKILADFAPLFVKKLSQLSSSERKEALEIIFDCLQEKHILIYFKDNSLEKLAIEEGWSGQLLDTDKDYLSVVSSNINGYKTDRVVKESIQHQAEIQPDGSIIDTLTIRRQHQGGHFEYDWWNRVNTNYLRVYLPLGSQLLSAQGQTIEIYQPPLDYQKQGFKADPLVSFIENKMIIDSKTGTHIFEENGKTVFGNWLYVSPGETVTLTYQYKLPFKIDLTKSTDSYSLLVQKQSGSLGSQFSHYLKFPANWLVHWQYPEQGKQTVGSWQLETDLHLDRFLGVTFEF